MPQKVTQLRYSESDVEQIRALFPDLDSLKLYRKYLLDLPLTGAEVTRINATWAAPAVREVMHKVTLPEITGDEAIGIGYDVLHNMDMNVQNFEYQCLRTKLFFAAAKHLSARLNGLDDLKTSVTGKGHWLTTSLLAGDFEPSEKVGYNLQDEDNAEKLLEQIVIRQNVEGILVGLNALIQPVETEEEKEKRIAADSTH